MLEGLRSILARRKKPVAAFRSRTASQRNRHVWPCLACGREVRKSLSHAITVKIQGVEKWIGRQCKECPGKAAK